MTLFRIANLSVDVPGRRLLDGVTLDLPAGRMIALMPLVVAGDLNADRHHPLFEGLLTQGLRDAADERGRGLSRTWPQRWPLLALDHVLVRDVEQAQLAVTGQ